MLKQVSGGLLVQDADLLRVTEAELKVVTERAADAGGDAGAAVCVERVQACEVECDCVCAGSMADMGRRSASARGR